MIAETCRRSAIAFFLNNFSNTNPMSAMHQLPQMLSIGEVAEIFSRSPRTIRDWVTRGLLQPVRVGRSVFIPKAQVDALLRGLPTVEYNPDTASDQTCCQRHANNSRSTTK